MKKTPVLPSPFFLSNQSGVDMHKNSTFACVFARVAVGLMVVTSSVSASAQPAPAFIPLDTLPDTSAESHATAVSADGSVVVGYCAAAAYRVEGFRWTASD